MKVVQKIKAYILEITILVNMSVSNEIMIHIFCEFLCGKIVVIRQHFIMLAYPIVRQILTNNYIRNVVL